MLCSSCPAAPPGCCCAPCGCLAAAAAAAAANAAAAAPLWAAATAAAACNASAALPARPGMGGGDLAPPMPAPAAPVGDGMARALRLRCFSGADLALPGVTSTSMAPAPEPNTGTPLVPTLGEGFVRAAFEDDGPAAEAGDTRVVPGVAAAVLPLPGGRPLPAPPRPPDGWRSGLVGPVAIRRTDLGPVVISISEGAVAEPVLAPASRSRGKETCMGAGALRLSPTSLEP
mmetsp:Transcript_33681/g.74591  ORF Transcript_33681/g.74591 Transcript_33681/m.74591 type:complete len:230 (-) Transcript_33681:772-1461(-)